MTARPVIVFDSGLGGLTVAHALRAQGYRGAIAYVADHAGFPYGALAADAMAARVLACAGAAIARFAPAVFIIACNTASTRALPALRARWPDLPFVGTVPAIKPAAAATASGLVSVLATPATVARDYTRDLIAQFAADKEVTLVGAPGLAGLAEDALQGGAVDAAALRAAIAPAFVEAPDGRRTDVIVLACTHYPLILDALEAAAPWRVAWLDPAPAVARRALDLVPALRDAAPAPGAFLSTGAPRLAPALVERLAQLGLAPAAAPLGV